MKIWPNGTIKHTTFQAPGTVFFFIMYQLNVRLLNIFTTA